MTTYQRSGNLTALLCVFNAEDLIQESIRSLADVCDSYIIADGKFKGFNCPCGNEHVASCDRTEEKVNEIRDELELDIHYTVMREVSWEYDKRQHMIDVVKENDCFFVLDDDELFYGASKEIREFVRKGLEIPPILLEREPPAVQWGPNPYAQYKCAFVDQLMIGGSIQNNMRLHVKTKGLKIISSSKRLDFTFEDYEGVYASSQCTRLKNARIVHLQGSGQPNFPAYRNKSREKAGLAYHVDMAYGRIKPI